MVTFTQLEQASDVMIERLLETVDRATWATALQGANARLIDRVLGKRSPEAIEDVLREIQRQQAVDLDTVERARQDVEQVAAELEAAGIPVWDRAPGR